LSQEGALKSHRITRKIYNRQKFTTLRYIVSFVRIWS